MMVLLLLLLLLFLLGTFVIYRLAFHTPKGNQNDHHAPFPGEQYEVFREETRALVEALEKKAYEEVWVENDGLKLFGRYYAIDPKAPVAICFHGYRGTDYRDFSGGSQLLFNLGWNVLLVSQRGHGRSEGHTITFGIREKEDLLEWVKYVEGRKDNNGKIVLFGISMGAATVTMASGLELSSSVKAIVADCPYSSPERIIGKVVGEDMKLPVRFAMPLVRVAARLYGGFSLRAESAAEAVVRTKVPLLILHGEEDKFVPDYMSAEIKEANPSMVQRETFPGAGHGLSFMVDKERYTRVVEEFLLSHL